MDILFRVTHQARCIISLAVVSFATQASACRLMPEAYNLEAFLASRHSNKIVFQGVVKSVTENTPSKEGTQTQNIRFNTNRWWFGRARETVAAHGVIGSMPNTSCAGVFDFSVKNSEVWLIVGYEEDGIIYPSPQLSSILTDGKIPPDTYRILRHRAK